jgi:RNA polymerase sigma-70 factor (ECF subfamily)
MVHDAVFKHKLNEDEARSAYSDALIALRKQVVERRFRGESKVATYLFRIFSNKCVDILRKNSTNPITAIHEYPDVADKSPGIFNKLSQKEDLEKAISCLNQIGDLCKKVLLDCIYWEYNMEEVAQRNGLIDAKNASDRKYKCLQKLRKLRGS